jgi:hypothetical protein
VTRAAVVSARCQEREKDMRPVETAVRRNDEREKKEAPEQ